MTAIKCVRRRAHTTCRACVIRTLCVFFLVRPAIRFHVDHGCPAECLDVFYDLLCCYFEQINIIDDAVISTLVSRRDTSICLCSALNRSTARHQFISLSLCLSAYVCLSVCPSDVAAAGHCFESACLTACSYVCSVSDTVCISLCLYVCVCVCFVNPCQRLASRSYHRQTISRSYMYCAWRQVVNVLPPPPKGQCIK